MPRTPKKEKNSKQLEIQEGSAIEQENNGRVQSLPSILDRKKKIPEEEEEPGVRRMSRNDDTLVSLEEYNAAAEILHPGRTQEELDARTDVNPLQIIHFSRGRVMARRFGIRYLDAYISSIERLSLSKARKSRLEHVKAISGLIGANNDKAPGLLQRLI